MGYAFAQAALDRGASVTLITGPVHIEPPDGCDTVSVETVDEMNQAVRKAAPDQDLIIMAAAVADLRTVEVKASKIKKEGAPFGIKLEKTPDILKGLRDISGAFLVGFALETENGEENAQRKMREKQLDAIVLNYANRTSSGFESDKNEGILFLKKYKKKILLPLESKNEIAHRILSNIQKGIMKKDKEKT